MLLHLLYLKCYNWQVSCHQFYKAESRTQSKQDRDLHCGQSTSVSSDTSSFRRQDEPNKSLRFPRKSKSGRSKVCQDLVYSVSHIALIDTQTVGNGHSYGQRNPIVERSPFARGIKAFRGKVVLKH